MIFPWLFGVNDVELMEPPSQLSEIVELGHGRKERMWVPSPESFRRKGVWDFHQDCLPKLDEFKHEGRSD
jgi:hypothetical protein